MGRKFAVVKFCVDRGVCGGSIISGSGVLGWASAIYGLVQRFLGSVLFRGRDKGSSLLVLAHVMSMLTWRLGSMD